MSPGQEQTADDSGAGRTQLADAAVGCRAWWSRLTPYPCWQVDWATSWQAQTITARFLEGAR